MIYHVSAVGLALIQAFEGTSPVVYRCPAGHQSIGYGHQVLLGERFAEPLSDAEMEALLIADCRHAESALSLGILASISLQQNEVDALVCLIFNIGVGSFSRSTLRQRINTGDRAGAANEFLRWALVNGIVSPGLLRRRHAEQALFLGAVR